MSRRLYRAFTLTPRVVTASNLNSISCIQKLRFATQTHETSKKSNQPVDLQHASSSSLLRGYFVYSLLSFPRFIDASPTILKIATSIPIVKSIALSAVRSTFFKHFVAGESFEETTPAIRSLRNQNLGSLAAYSVEVDPDQASSESRKDSVPQYERNIEEILSSIPLAAEIENAQDNDHPATRKTWIAVKLSALLPSADSLEAFSSTLLTYQTKPDTPFGIEVLYNPPEDSTMSESDLIALKSLHTSLKAIGNSGAKHQIRIIVDAEYSWYQPAIDAFTTDLMQRFNSSVQPSPVNPVVYLTFQAYLQSTPNRLKNALHHATQYGYTLGVKLVRGAYHLQELEHSTSSSVQKLPPVWLEKADTDRCYNECIDLLLDQVGLPQSGSVTSNSTSIGILFGTHNKESCELILEGLNKRELVTAEQTKSGSKVWRAGYSTSAQVQIGQLLGMADDLTSFVSSHLECSDAPMVMKYLPYGSLEDVMPYLARRAIENKSVLGNSNTVIERQRIVAELQRRLLHRQ